MWTLLAQTSFTIVSLILAGLIAGTPALSGYTLQILAVSILLFFLLHRLSKRRQVSFTLENSRQNLFAAAEISILQFAVVLSIIQTGGFVSVVLPLYLIFLLLFCFVLPLFPSLVSFVITLIVFTLATPAFNEQVIGSLLSLIVFFPIALIMQHVYTDLVTERQAARLEREKVAYYNLYAEKQQAALLEKGDHTDDLGDCDDYLQKYVVKLIPQIDELQKLSRFPENQLVVSAQLTKLGLSIRRALKKSQK